MFPDFFIHKFREVGSFIEILKGRIMGDSKVRLSGVENALKAMKDERKVYEKERRDALRRPMAAPIDQTGEMIDRPVRESENRDISAI